MRKLSIFFLLLFTNTLLASELFVIDFNQDCYIDLIDYINIRYNIHYDNIDFTSDSFQNTSSNIKIQLNYN